VRDWDWEHEERGEKEIKENMRWLMADGGGKGSR
jgi:hypothetical protein